MGLRTGAFDPNLYPSSIIQSILDSAHSDLNLARLFTLLWNMWKARNDLLFNKKHWTPLQVHFATTSLLSAGPMEYVDAAFNHPQARNGATLGVHPKNPYSDSITVKPSATRTPPSSPLISSLPAGPKIFVDAAFNPSQAGNLAALGVFLQNPNANASIYIQAISLSTVSALQAEAQALALAALVARALSWRDASFITDCKTLAEAVKANNILSNMGHWNIRPFLAEFFNAASHGADRVFFFPRNSNRVAHALARRAFRDRSDHSCSYLCKKNLVFSLCRSRCALESLDLPFGRLQAVLCDGC